MPTVTILNGPNKDQVHTINGGEFVGRDPSNTIQVVAPGVSRVHFQFLNEGGNFVIQDQNSSNGTYVNNVRVTKKLLAEQDSVTVGGVTLRFSYQDAGAGGDLTLEQPRIADPEAGLPGLRPGTPTRGDLNRSVVFQESPEEATAAGENLEDYSLDASMIFSDSTKLDFREDPKYRNLEKRLNVYYKVSQGLGSAKDPGELLDQIMNALFDVFPQADRSFIMIGDSFETLDPKVVRHRQGGDGEVQISKTIARKVFCEKQSILSANAMEDSRFSGGMSILNFRILSMMCVPLIFQDEAYGLIHMDTQNRQKKFTPDDLTMMTGIAAQAAIFIKNSKLLDKIKDEAEKRTNLERYFSPEFAAKVVNKEIDLRLGGARKLATVLFSDIIGFTKMSEKMEPEAVVEKINRYFQRMVEIIHKHKGYIDKFGGDAIMAVWGAAEPHEDDTIRAVTAAVEMQNGLFQFNFDMLKEEQALIQMGLGLNTGHVVAGNIGSERRMEFTVIGDNVNLAQRVESKAGRGQVFISETSYERCKGDVIAVKLQPITTMKGKTGAFTIYSIRGVATKDPQVLVLSLPVRFEGEEEGLIVKSKRAAPDSPEVLTLILAASQLKPGKSTLKIAMQEHDAFSVPCEIQGEVPVQGLTGHCFRVVTRVESTPFGTLLDKRVLESDKSPDTMARH